MIVTFPDDLLNMIFDRFNNKRFENVDKTTFNVQMNNNLKLYIIKYLNIKTKRI